MDHDDPTQSLHYHSASRIITYHAGVVRGSTLSLYYHSAARLTMLTWHVWGGPRRRRKTEDGLVHSDEALWTAKSRTEFPPSLHI